MITTKLLSAALGLLLWLPHLQAGESVESERLDFTFEGRRLSGVLDRPAGRPASGIVVLVHGHGQTNAIAGQWYGDLRSRFAEMGLASYVWDKAGCGQSEGTYDHNQSVQSGAREALAAIGELKRRNVAGSDHIGLWGISRAGWICPLVIEEMLALFGEKDSIVDWRRTLALYQETMGRSEGALLTVRTFPGCNHNLQQCRTGEFRETRTSPLQPACEGYLDTISAWIRAKGLGAAR